MNLNEMVYVLVEWQSTSKLTEAEHKNEMNFIQFVGKK